MDTNTHIHIHTVASPDETKSSKKAFLLNIRIFYLKLVIVQRGNLTYDIPRVRDCVKTLPSGIVL